MVDALVQGGFGPDLLPRHVVLQSFEKQVLQSFPPPLPISSLPHPAHNVPAHCSLLSSSLRCTRCQTGIQSCAHRAPPLSCLQQAPTRTEGPISPAQLAPIDDTAFEALCLMKSWLHSATSLPPPSPRVELASATLACRSAPTPELAPADEVRAMLSQSLLKLLALLKAAGMRQRDLPAMTWLFSCDAVPDPAAVAAFALFGQGLGPDKAWLPAPPSNPPPPHHPPPRPSLSSSLYYLPPPPRSGKARFQKIHVVIPRFGNGP